MGRYYIATPPPPKGVEFMSYPRIVAPPPQAGVGVIAPDQLPNTFRRAEIMRQPPVVHPTRETRQTHWRGSVPVRETHFSDQMRYFAPYGVTTLWPARRYDVRGGVVRVEPQFYAVQHWLRRRIPSCIVVTNMPRRAVPARPTSWVEPVPFRGPRIEAQPEAGLYRVVGAGVGAIPAGGVITPAPAQEVTPAAGAPAPPLVETDVASGVRRTLAKLEVLESRSGEQLKTAKRAFALAAIVASVGGLYLIGRIGR